MLRNKLGDDEVALTAVHLAELIGYFEAIISQLSDDMVAPQFQLVQRVDIGGPATLEFLRCEGFQ
jgi:hypothetical protein